MKIVIASLLASVAAGSVLASPAAAQHAGHSPAEPQQSAEAQADAKTSKARELLANGEVEEAIEAFADALEIIPATVAENAGFDPLDIVLAMRNKVQNDSLNYGPDVNNGGIIDMKEEEVFEPSMLIRQAVLSATEVTTAILRIDDIVSRRPVE